MNEFVFYRDAQHAVDPSAKPGTTLFMLGLWIRLGFTGASALLAALVSLADAETPAGLPLLLAIGGAVLAIVSWLRVQRAFEEHDAPTRRAGPPNPTHATVSELG